MSCVSAAACTAVGSSENTRSGFSRTLVESWNGTNWSLTPSPNAAIAGNGLVGVSCVRAAACTAAGTKVYVRGDAEYPRTLIESGTPHG